jgi:hypothetical protein
MCLVLLWHHSVMLLFGLLCPLLRCCHLLCHPRVTFVRLQHLVSYGLIARGLHRIILSVPRRRRQVAPATVTAGGPHRDRSMYSAAHLALLLIARGQNQASTGSFMHALHIGDACRPGEGWDMPKTASYSNQNCQPFWGHCTTLESKIFKHMCYPHYVTSSSTSLWCVTNSSTPLFTH